VSQLVRVLNMNGCPVENTHPPLIQQNPDQGGQCEGIKPGLQTAARAAYDQTKGNPQLIVVILPVSMCCRVLPRDTPLIRSVKTRCCMLR
jgi:eukaryotic translation initiation factor 2C